MRTKCEEEFAKLLEITRRNMLKIYPRGHQQEGKTSHEEERQDEAYLKWKEDSKNEVPENPSHCWKVIYNTSQNCER